MCPVPMAALGPERVSETTPLWQNGIRVQGESLSLSREAFLVAPRLEIFLYRLLAEETGPRSGAGASVFGATTRNVSKQLRVCRTHVAAALWVFPTRLRAQAALPAVSRRTRGGLTPAVSSLGRSGFPPHTAREDRILSRLVPTSRRLR